MAKGGVNEKKQKGMEIKAANKAAKDEKAAAERSKQEAESWNQGANLKGAAKAQSAAEKADEAARKKAEKAALLAEEEANAGPSKITKVPKLSQKKKNDPLALLEATLVSSADKKVKADKKKERERKEKEEQMLREKEKQRVLQVQNQDPLLANTDAMLGGAIHDDDDDDLMGGSGSGKLNKALEHGEVDASGIDAALSAMSMSNANGIVDEHPEKRMKALHKAFEEKMMGPMKEEYPGLKRSQYQERIFNLWKKSPENPMNWPKKV